MTYNFKKIEAKWQKKWEEKKIFEVAPNGVPSAEGKEGKKAPKGMTSSPSRSGRRSKYYVLEMFPYPSASGLHMGHALNYTIGDVFARYKRMQGFNVLYPMGFDALGLPAENAAIQAGEHPKPFTKNAIKNYIRQMRELGLSYDWSKIVSTMESEYYVWNQYFFLKMLEKGLVYRKKAPVNFCEKCNTVLANEQVHNGKCWRHENTKVQIKQLEQWFIKTTTYAEELLDKIDELQWPDRVKIMQKNWIGKSKGAEIIFEIIPKVMTSKEASNDKWPVFTTRPDTIYGVTFMVISAQHSKLMELVTEEKKNEVGKFLHRSVYPQTLNARAKKIKTISEKGLNSKAPNQVGLKEGVPSSKGNKDITEEGNKEGIFTGSYVINPINNEKIPVYVGNFVVADYGSGMVMGVPAHDQRDFDFAKKYKIPIKEVIKGGNIKKKAYVDEGVLINSDKFDGLKNKEAKEHIIKYLEKKNLGKKTIQYKLRDWLISRQRYWGTPIPIIYCEKCGIVPEKNLPVLLPERVKFGKGNPLATNKNFVNVKCSKCKGKAKRETDTMDTFFDSSWYYLRYCDNKNNKEAFGKKKVKYWMPVDQYIGVVEHACMHLIYARFFTKFLRDLGFLDFDEPFTKLFNQGMLYGSDGEKMSKSKGNVINPDEVSKKYGMDTARFFLLSLAAPDKPRDWSDEGIKGSLKFIKKIIDYFQIVEIKKTDKKIESKSNKTIKEVTNYINNFKYNLAIIKIRDLFNSFPKENSKKVLENFLKLLHPFCPHITEELWEKLGNKNFISLEKWPKYDEKKIDENLEKQEQFVKKIGEDINHIKEIVKIKNPTVYVYAIPSDLPIIEENKETISTMSGAIVIPYAVNDKNIHDPEGKAKKAKPGKPGIYME